MLTIRESIVYAYEKIPATNVDSREGSNVGEWLKKLKFDWRERWIDG